MEDRFKGGQMSFNDFLKQVQMMQKVGSMTSMMSKVPGMGGKVPDKAQLEEGEKRLRRYSTFVEQMTEEEQLKPDLVIREAQALKGGDATGERLVRIAAAAKCQVKEPTLYAYMCIYQSIYRSIDISIHLYLSILNLDQYI